MYMYIYIYIYVHISLSLSLSMHIYIYIYIYTHICMYTMVSMIQTMIIIMRRPGRKARSGYTLGGTNQTFGWVVCDSLGSRVFRSSKGLRGCFTTSERCV